MILVHRLRGEPLFLNADLVESVEACPDTTVTLVDGRRYIVQDRPEDLVDRIRLFRASVLVAADELRGGRPHLTVVGPGDGRAPLGGSDG